MKVASQKNIDTPSLDTINSISLDESIKRITENIVCPKCGCSSSDGASFRLECSVDSLTISVLKNNTLNIWLSKENKFNNLSIKNIKCMQCLNYSDFIKFINNQEDKNFFTSRVINIGEKWSCFKTENKSFFIKTGLIPRKLNKDDLCLIGGISFSEIIDKSQINDNNIIFKEYNKEIL